MVDDEKLQRDYMLHLVSSWAKANNIKAQIDLFESAEQFKMMRDAPYDILLLDIQMGGQDGVSLAKELRAASENMSIIFVTGLPDFLHEGYDVSALHYLMKPVDEDKLFAVLDRAVEQIVQACKTAPQLLLTVEGEAVRIPVLDILYVESFAHYLEIGLPGRTIAVKMPAYRLEQQLGQGFVRCHRSYLVGIRHVSKITKTDVVLDSGKVLPLSRRLYWVVSEAFMAYINSGNVVF